MRSNHLSSSLSGCTSVFIEKSLAIDLISQSDAIAYLYYEDNCRYTLLLHAAIYVLFPQIVENPPSLDTQALAHDQDIMDGLSLFFDGKRVI